MKRFFKVTGAVFGILAAMVALFVWYDADPSTFWRIATPVVWVGGFYVIYQLFVEPVQNRLVFMQNQLHELRSDIRDIANRQQYILKALDEIRDFGLEDEQPD